MRSAPLLIVLAAMTGACTEPALLDQGEPEAITEPLEAQDPDATDEQLRLELDRLVKTVTTARDHLVAATETSSIEDARAAGAAAAGLLVDTAADAEEAGDAPELETADDDPTEPQLPPSLFPADDPDRGDAGQRRDHLTTALAASRDADELGREATDVLREVVAGDLGAWQRDAAGMAALIRATADPDAGLDVLEAGILELPGEGTRAVAWALLTAEADDLTAARQYAERGVAHLEVMLAALDELAGQDAATGLTEQP